MFKQVKSRRGSSRTGTNNDNVAIKHSAVRVPQAAEGQKVMGSRTVVQFRGKDKFCDSYYSEEPFATLKG